MKTHNDSFPSRNFSISFRYNTKTDLDTGITYSTITGQDLRFAQTTNIPKHAETLPSIQEDHKAFSTLLANYVHNFMDELLIKPPSAPPPSARTTHSKDAPLTSETRPTPLGSQELLGASSLTSLRNNFLLPLPPIKAKVKSSTSKITPQNNDIPPDYHQNKLRRSPGMNRLNDILASASKTTSNDGRFCNNLKSYEYILNIVSEASKENQSTLKTHRRNQSLCEHGL